MLLDVAPTGPSQPQPSPQTPASAGVQQQVANDPNISASVRAWDRMFQGMASADQIKQMINGILKDTVQQIKSDGDKALEAIKQMKQQQEEDMDG
jgi:Glu-tRNA(Gln) amidotransferase subunit E-like FAD-binding protein